MPQRLVRRGKGGDLLKYALPNFSLTPLARAPMHRRVLIPRDLCSPRMSLSRRRVRPVNLLRSASEGDHQSPSPPLPMTTSAKGAHLTRQPSESGAGPRRTPPEIILIGCIVYVYGTSSAALMRRRLRPRPCRTIPTSCRCCCCPSDCLLLQLSGNIYFLAPLHLYCPFP